MARRTVTTSALGNDGTLTSTRDDKHAHLRLGVGFFFVLGETGGASSSGSVLGDGRRPPGGEQRHPVHTRTDTRYNIAQTRCPSSARRGETSCLCRIIHKKRHSGIDTFHLALARMVIDVTRVAKCNFDTKTPKKTYKLFAREIFFWRVKSKIYVFWARTPENMTN